MISAFGDVSNVNIITSTIEDPAPDHVQVRVSYSGFSGTDINMRLGRYPMQRKAPLTPGYCLVGTVEKCGSTSKKFRAGDVVACMSIYDAEAELANMPEKYLVPVPDGVDIQKACALIVDWTTAYGMAMHSGHVHSGQKVFIHGLSGAVGYALGTLCRRQGATVYGTASERNHAALQELGWKPFVYSNKDWVKEMKEIKADVVFDPLGFESWDESYSILSSHGLLIGYGGNLSTLNGQTSGGVLGPTLKLLGRNALTPFTHKSTKFYYITRDDRAYVPDLVALFKLLAEGAIDVRIKAVFALEDIQDAHRSWNKPGQGIGSMLVNIGAVNES